MSNRTVLIVTLGKSETYKETIKKKSTILEGSREFERAEIERADSIVRDLTEPCHVATTPRHRQRCSQQASNPRSNTVSRGSREGRRASQRASCSRCLKISC